MKIAINLSDDKELRDSIKTMIDGQVKNITRGYIYELFQQEKDRVMQATIKQMIQKVLREDWNLKADIKKKICEMVGEMTIEDLLKN